ncbi:MAG: hypothetical protein M0C28_39345 [Candidatus Moduliflexus flocculans]|nr:hypothetical protein [Candidatus Moduliflexus flocculans]
MASSSSGSESDLILRRRRGRKSKFILGAKPRPTNGCQKVSDYDCTPGEGFACGYGNDEATSGRCSEGGISVSRDRADEGPPPRRPHLIEENKVVVSLMTGEVRPGVPVVFYSLTRDVSDGRRADHDGGFARSRLPRPRRPHPEPLPQADSGRGRGPLGPGALRRRGLRGRPAIRRPRARRRVRPHGPYLRRQERSAPLTRAGRLAFLPSLG